MVINVTILLQYLKYNKWKSRRQIHHNLFLNDEVHARWEYYLWTTFLWVEFKYCTIGTSPQNIICFIKISFSIFYFKNILNWFHILSWHLLFLYCQPTCFLIGQWARTQMKDELVLCYFMCSLMVAVSCFLRTQERDPYLKHKYRKVISL